jgi:hypothetical protein
MTLEQYHEIMGRLAAAGAARPAGRLYHACFGSDDQLRVFDVWEDAESFVAFTQTLVVVAKELGIEPGAAAITDLHNVIAGDAAARA